PRTACCTTTLSRRSMPTRDDFLASLHRDIELFETAVRAGGDMTQLVDGCGDWTLASVVEHVGGLHRFITAGIELGDPGKWPKPPEDQATYADWFAEGAAALETALTSRPDDTPCWT